MKFVIALLFVAGIMHLDAQTNFWQRTNGSNGTYVSSIATNASGHVFAIAIDSGLFRATNDGASSVNIRPRYVSSVVVAPDNRILVTGIDSGRGKVFDLLGQEVARLVDGQSKPGRFEVTFDASELSSGVYFYRLEVDGMNAVRYIQTKKLMLLR